MNHQINLGNFNVATDFVDVAGTFNLWGGTTLSDIDADGNIDITHSRNTMTKFHKVLEGETTSMLHVINSQKKHL